MLYFSISVLQTGLVRLRPALEGGTVVLLPLVGGAWLLCLGEEIQEEQHDLAKRLIVALFLFYIWILVCSLFLARINPDTFQEDCRYYRSHLDLMTNFRPLKTIRLYIRCLIYDYIGMDIPLSNLIGNVILFMPMSLFLPILFPAMRRFFPWMGVTICILLLTEALQFAFCCGSCDVDDVLLNLIGALPIYGFFHLPLIRRFLIRSHILKPEAAVAEDLPCGGKPEEEKEAGQNNGNETDTAEIPPCPEQSASEPGRELVDTLIAEEEQGDCAGTGM
jgi:glycopeptide antibiotics resistance protein